VVDNRPGAGGNLGAEIAAHAAPDGNTLYMGFAGTHAMNVSLYPKLNYDPVADFTPLSLLIESPLALTVHPSVPAKTLAELTAYAKANPEALAFGSSGNGGASHRALELYKAAAGVPILHVPYRGAAAANTDLLGGKIQGMFDTLITAMPNISAVAVRALAVTGRGRAALLPDVPTMAEQGFPDFVVSAWLGLAAPAATDPRIVARLSDEVAKAVASPEVVARISTAGAEPKLLDAEGFQALVQREIPRWAEVIKTGNVTVN